ncbi:alpha/beta hydrolase family protein [Caulobacter sp. DWP3-1-3b2]|uniref:alpha/beta hydrolase family protein n=1 Tax=Caulobacter sp. DWP3-1-3b2 TaxID=2804643 RepID=UPI003CFB8729
MKALACLTVIGALLLAAPASAQIHERIYPAPTAPLDLAGLPTGAVINTVRTADGLTLKGLEIAPRDGKPTLLMFHGNGSSAATSMRWLAPLLTEGYGLVAAEYREYSGNPGRASEAGLAADADAFFARARVVSGGGKLIVVGHSLGGGVAFGLARRQKLDALVTIGTFTDLRTMAPAAARWMISDRYDNAGAIVTLDEPCYLVHGTADQVVPYAHGQALRAAGSKARKNGALFTVGGAGHGPDGAVLAMILRAVAAKTQGGGVMKVQLPPGVQLTPFGS